MLGTFFLANSILRRTQTLQVMRPIPQILWLLRQQVCIPVGCASPVCCPHLPACTAPGGCTWSGGQSGVYLVRGVPGLGVYLVRGCVPGLVVYLVWGDVPGPGGCTCPGTHLPPPCGQTDTCKNITFANFVCGR